MKWIALLLTCTSVLFGAPQKLPEPQAAKDEQILDQRENHFQTATPYRISPHVNPITGDLIEEEADLVVAGSEPLSLRRFYNHSVSDDPRYGGWRYNPEAYLVANFEWHEQERFAAAGEFDGSISSFRGSPVYPYTYDSDPAKGFTNFSSDGQSHPLNTRVNYLKKGDPKEKGRFSWQGTITDGSGKKRFFASNMHTWHHHIYFTGGKKRFLSSGAKIIYKAFPNVWIPYQLPIHETKLPNGNVLCYSYVRWKDDKHYPKPVLLNTITAYSADKTKILGFLHFAYNKDKHEEVRGFTVTGSDGRQAGLHHHGKSPILLIGAVRPDQPVVNYGYRGSWVIDVQKPDGRLLHTEYNAAGKVAVQSAPVGPNGEMLPIGSYDYHANATVVTDAEGNIIVYRFNDKKQLLSLDTHHTHQGSALYRSDRFSWDSNGNLIQKSVVDGVGNLLQLTECKYDKNHNCIEERTGDGTEWHTVSRTFSEDGFNLKLSESDCPGRVTRYAYLPETNLLVSEFFYEGERIRQRTFHTYDNAAICIKTIVDDGTTKDPSNLGGVTYRTITEIQPKQSLPCFGLPEVVLEKTIDAAGEEVLLKKICYTYTPFGKVAKEEHYDCNGDYCYTIDHTYDAKERLITKTDALGNKTTFTYDDNHNVTSISGPRNDQHKEITYDKANRATRMAEWQSDGSILITEKQYDKLGQVIAEKDACGNTTRFEYDALGRRVAVRHPDGGVERKEYNVLGYLTKEINALGQEIRKTYNFKGQPLATYYPDGSEEHFTYFEHGPLASHIDKNGAKRVYTLDIFDHPIKTETYSSSGKLLKTTTANYSPFHKLSETDGRGVTTLYSYDFAGRKIGEQKEYKTLLFSYDSLGRLEQKREGEITWIEKQDFLGHVLEKRTENKGNPQFQEMYRYDAAGNRIETRNSQGVHSMEYNTDGKLLSTTDPLGRVTRFNYTYGKSLTESVTNPHKIQTLLVRDVKGRDGELLKKNARGEAIQQAKSVFDHNNQRIDLMHTVFDGVTPVKTVSHHWDYGPMGRVERFIEAGLKQTDYLYDAKGRLKTIVKPNGERLNHEYDECGRLSRYFSHDFDYHYAYDPNDSLLSVYDAATKTKTTRAYDALNNITQEELANGLRLVTAFDTHGRKVALTLPDGTAIDYSYEGVYLKQVHRNGLKHTYEERNKEGELLKSILPGNLGEISIQRDALGRWEKVHSPFYTSKLRYDEVGNLIQNAFKDSLGKQKRVYAFDDLEQLISEEEHTYRFDSLYNRVKKDELDHEVNALCQITHDGETAYVFDVNGNLISDGERKFVYDSQDRLIAVEDQDKKTRFEYAYDPFHRRLWKKEFKQGKQVNYERYLWDGQNEIGVADEKGKIQQLRVLGEGLGAEIGAAVLCELKGASYVPIHDHQGSLVSLIDLESKKPVQSCRYTAYGEELTESMLSPWRFSSKRVDETGLIFFGRRYYSPELGRWITTDPAGFKGGPNLYAYVRNDPLTEMDLYGLFSIGNCFGAVSRMAFRSVEWLGANIVPIPYVRTVVESIGRWGAGGEFRGASRYRTPQCEIIPIKGRTVPHLSFTHGNGIATTRDQAIAQAQELSTTHGGVHVDLLYQGTQGIFMDLLNCLVAKLGICTPYNRMCADYFQEKLREDPDHWFRSNVHSRGGTEIMNTGHLLSPDQRQRIDVFPYGSATLIPKGYFHTAKNNLCPLDLVTMSNPVAYFLALFGNRFYDVNILPPATCCPYKVHGILEDTYGNAIRRKGREFQSTFSE